MFQHLLYLTLTFVCFMEWSKSYELRIDRRLDGGGKVPRGQEITVKVDVCKDVPEDPVSVSVDLPIGFLMTNKPSVRVFFANDKEILRVNFNLEEKQMNLIFYKSPHYKDRSEECTQYSNRESHILYCCFPKSWMPENCSRVNAAIEFSNGTIYNLYGIKNYPISIPDMMVLEEYRNHACV